MLGKPVSGRWGGWRKDECRRPGTLLVPRIRKVISLSSAGQAGAATAGIWKEDWGRLGHRMRAPVLAACQSPMVARISRISCLAENATNDDSWRHGSVGQASAVSGVWENRFARRASGGDAGRQGSAGQTGAVSGARGSRHRLLEEGGEEGRSARCHEVDGRYD